MQTGPIMQPVRRPPRAPPCARTRARPRRCSSPGTAAPPTLVRGRLRRPRRRRPAALGRGRGGRRPPRGSARPARRTDGSPLPGARRGRPVVASSLLRAQGTAKMAGERLGLDVAADDGWAEARFGAWDGLTHADVPGATPRRSPPGAATPVAPPEASPSTLWRRPAARRALPRTQSPPTPVPRVLVVDARRSRSVSSVRECPRRWSGDAVAAPGDANATPTALRLRAGRRGLGW